MLSIECKRLFVHTLEQTKSEENDVKKVPASFVQHYIICVVNILTLTNITVETSPSWSCSWKNLSSIIVVILYVSYYTKNIKCPEHKGATITKTPQLDNERCLFTKRMFFYMHNSIIRGLVISTRILFLQLHSFRCYSYKKIKKSHVYS